MARVALRTVAVVGVVALVGALFQAVGERRDARANPAPGDHVDIGGRDLHLHVLGEEDDGPTVVFEAGMGAPGLSWDWVQPVVAEHARTVSYDRAGIGWSDDAPDDRGAYAAVDDLRAALRARGLPPPYVLVGHSMGAFHTRLFAARHPADVAALVLVDPSHEDQNDELPEDMAASLRRAPTMLSVAAGAAHLGVLRIWNPTAAVGDGMPDHTRRAYDAWSRTPRSLQALAREMRAFDSYADAARSDASDLGALPVRILSADTADVPDQQWTVDDQLRRHERLLALSSDSARTVVEGATHFTVVTHRENAERVAQEVAAVVDQLARS